MISTEVRGAIGQLPSDLGPAMQEISDYMLESVRQNFAQQGRPNKWLPIRWFGGRPGHPVLNYGGRLYQNIMRRWSMGANEATAEVYVSRGSVPYAFVHQFGRTWTPTPAQRRAFWAKNKGQAWDGTRRGQWKIDARPYMMFQDEDKEEIKARLLNYIIKFYETTKTGLQEA